MWLKCRPARAVVASSVSWKPPLVTPGTTPSLRILAHLKHWRSAPALLHSSGDQPKLPELLQQVFGHELIAEWAEVSRNELGGGAVATRGVERRHRIDHPISFRGKKLQQGRVALGTFAAPAGEVTAFGEDQDDRLRSVVQRHLVERRQQVCGQS